MNAPRQGRATPHLAEQLATVPVVLTDEADLEDTRVTGEHLSVNAAFVELNGCRLDAVAMVGGHLRRSRLVDCLVMGCDLTGVVLEDCNLLRVEFHDCRMSAFQTPECRFEDVGFFNCKLDGANFRMSTWKRSHFDGCDLAEADFYGVDVSPSDHRALIGASLSRFQKHDRFGSLRFEIVR
jgi:uncharacterized protein YjbI with pentapeptide repeats